MKLLLLLLALLSGCATNAVLRPQAEAAQTLQDVNMLVLNRPVQVYFKEGRAPESWRDVRLNDESVLVRGPLLRRTYPMAFVERIEINRHPHAPIYGMLTGNVVGMVVGMVMPGLFCNERGAGAGVICTLQGGLRGGLVGAAVGFGAGLAWDAHDPPVVVYQGSPDRYGVR